MNNISSPYPLHQCRWNHEMSSSPEKQTINHQDIIQVNPFSNILEGCPDNLPIFKLDNKNKAAACNSSDTTNNIPNRNHHNHRRVNENKMKMVLRRDVERQRRQEMTSLYNSLRSILPLEYIKGKRSVSDHMNEAVNYIKHLQKKIQEMKDKRDGLKRLFSYSNPSVIPRGVSYSQLDFVTVQPCFCGFEVAISTSLSYGLLPLSRVLQALLADGLTVSSCVSTRVNERSLHTILVEVSDLRGINTMELQQKLMDLIQYSSRNPMFAGTKSYVLL
ncbi:Myc-type [Macleaya cordata]|uniref:Myc-type n=1 Tax=Macleaya cordata TaxID=56857 RepID=A0A200RC81_MACCD|nr:Myc-type [Macleaya cordata]